MKKLFSMFALLALLLALIPAMPAKAQVAALSYVPPPNCVVFPVLDPGTGALVRKDMVCAPLPVVPPKNELVVYAHGYVAPDAPIDFPADQMVLGGMDLPTLVTGMGYYFAATTYSKNGLAVLQGLQDTFAVTMFAEGFIAAAVPPFPAAAISKAYLIGPSEGGLVTALAIEQNPVVDPQSGKRMFAGGLSLCGPVGNFRKQINYYGDFRVIFDYFFPGFIQNDPSFGKHKIWISQDTMLNWDTIFNTQVVPTLAANPTKLALLLKVTKAAYDPANPPTALNTVKDLLWYDVFANNDGWTTLGGEPFSNNGKRYSGSTNDVLLNRSVQRVIADDVAVENMLMYNTTGKLTVPLVTMHTTGDDVIPFWHETLYLNKVLAAGKGSLLTQIPVPAYGHCNFTLEQAQTAFVMMIVKATLAAPAGVQVSLPSAAQLSQYRAKVRSVAVPK